MVCKIKILLIFVLTQYVVYAQTASSNEFSLSQVSKKYVSAVDHKIEKYNNQIISKTEKTLTKLSKWETKIHKLLHNIDPDLETQLFGNNQLTFTLLLQKLKEGKSVVENYQAQYDQDIDKLSTGLKYLQQQKSQLDSSVVNPLKNANDQVKDLKNNLGNVEYIKGFIKERKKQLVAGTYKIISKSKYLSKINKESYYYIETLKNYKVIFSDTKKTEEVVKEGLNKIPAFKKFFQQNSQYASLFGSTGTANVPALAGLQSRSSVQALVQQRIASGGVNAQAQVQQNLAAAHVEINKLKDRINSVGSNSDNVGMPAFKPNIQKTKTFFQRLEYGFNVQFEKANSLIPTSGNFAATTGYKLSDKVIAGLGISYKIGMGSIQHIRITNQAISLRSFAEYKIKKQFFMTAGFEMNYNSVFKHVVELKNYNAWQRSALAGVIKKYSISKKVKGTVQLLYDFLAQQHVPVSQSFVYRLGYNF